MEKLDFRLDIFFPKKLIYKCGEGSSTKLIKVFEISFLCKMLAFIYLISCFHFRDQTILVKKKQKPAVFLESRLTELGSERKDG